MFLIIDAVPIVKYWKLSKSSLPMWLKQTSNSTIALFGGHFIRTTSWNSRLNVILPSIVTTPIESSSKPQLQKLFNLFLTLRILTKVLSYNTMKTKDFSPGPFGVLQGRLLHNRRNKYFPSIFLNPFSASFSDINDAFDTELIILGVSSRPRYLY